MTFERTKDPELIRSVLTHPKVWPHITDDFSGSPESYEPPMHEAIVYLTVLDGDRLLGLFMFHPHTRICWEVHTCLLPHCWGVRAAEAAKGAAEWMWANTEAQRIITSVPAYNRLALRFAERAGMKQWGVNGKSFQKGGVLHDQIMLGLSKVN